ncbi:unnamed protein product [Acanthoscelides obtectus]|uniref:RNA-directed DNA polymerase n=1 Tax=Acanthoscelides obtectus TaxID=200917 RepID=A0A9P0PQT0_ACAOB|nr:unnamed protein product [Acanthoscelides obtectus]CAK1641164.1 Uncharacterized protein K02A2.6 [Acanthoscelides obtectus]
MKSMLKTMSCFGRVIIPFQLREVILKELHATHLGIVKMKYLARSYFWWPSLNDDIESVSNQCNIWQRLQSSPAKAALQCWQIPEGIWSWIHIDFFEPKKNNFFLIVVDAFSKWLEVFPMASVTTNMTITKLRELFSRFGLPKTIASDNGPQLVSEEFKQFANVNGIKLITIPPYEPHCNGAAENSVKTVKIFLKKVSDQKNCNLLLAQFLMTYRNTVHCSTGYSPAKVFLGRSLRTRFDMLRPSSVQDNEKVELENVYQNIQRSQRRNVKYFRGNRKVCFNIDQIVLVKDYRDKQVTWCKGQVVKILGKNVYVVRPLDSNFLWKRHTNQIRELNDDYSLVYPPCVELPHTVNVFSNSDGASNTSAGSSVDDVFVDAGIADSERVDVSDSDSSSIGEQAELTRPIRIRKVPDRLQY